MNLKPGRPLQTISYRSLPVNPNNIGKKRRCKRRTKKDTRIGIQKLTTLELQGLKERHESE